MLKRLTTSLLDTIYPPRCLACTEATDAPNGLCPACWRDCHFIVDSACSKCGVPLIGDADDDEICENCRRHPPTWDQGAAAMLYRGAGRRMVLALKHGDRLDTVGPLAMWMARSGSDILAATDVISPVPLHWRRQLKRRYNQSAELVRRIALISGVHAEPQLLVRQRYTIPQEKMDRVARTQNQSGAFAVHARTGRELSGKTVTLVDDVLTSGATLSACADVLKGAGASKVNVLVLCRVAFGESESI